jgi:hypothetical protein
MKGNPGVNGFRPVLLATSRISDWFESARRCNIHLFGNEQSNEIYLVRKSLEPEEESSGSLDLHYSSLKE